MTAGIEPGIETFRRAVAAAFPDLSGATFRILGSGWHSTAVEVDGRHLFKFPRHAAAEEALAREARLLATIRPALTLPVPDLILLPGPPRFTRHEKIEGEHLLTGQYDRLPERDRQRLGETMALFYAELHRLDPGGMAAAGATAIQPWLAPEVVLDKAVPALPSSLRPLAERTVRCWQDLPPDPLGTTFGFFDGHGWNMAFDHARSRLNGLYDFADSGFGDLHQEFICSNFIAPDLTERIIAGYEALTGHRIDRWRVALLTGALRLSELAELADDPAHLPLMIANVADWAANQRLLP